MYKKKLLKFSFLISLMRCIVLLESKSRRSVLFACLTIDWFPIFLLDSMTSKGWWTPAQKAFYVLQFANCEFVITVQCAFHRKFNCDLPNDNNIRRWYNQFGTIRCLCIKKSTKWPRVVEENFEFVHADFPIEML